MAVVGNELREQGRGGGGGGMKGGEPTSTVDLVDVGFKLRSHRQ